MKNIFIIIISTATFNSVYSKVEWNDWKKIAHEDVQVYSDQFQTSLASVTQAISDLLKLHTDNSNLTKKDFNKQLKAIFKSYTKEIITISKKFHKEIDSEAHNTYRFKIKQVIENSIASPEKNSAVQKNNET